jgi:arginase
MSRWSIIGAPSSAGAYAPGQDRAPAKLREAGLARSLRERGLEVRDRGDVAGFRWRPDRENPRAMNAAAVARVARDTAAHVERTLLEGDMVLVLGGDCTVELGTVTGALRLPGEVGLLYIDLDTDLNTPESTTDGALDWMGVAHLLAVPGCLDELAKLGPRAPLLHARQLHYFAIDNVEPFERRLIEQLGIANTPLAEVTPDPARAARHVLDTWGRAFDRLLIHLDVDVLDFADMPLAENTRRNVGLKFDQLLAALPVFLRAPNLAAITICELNPDHGAGDGSTLRAFVAALSDSIDSVGRG